MKLIILIVLVLLTTAAWVQNTEPSLFPGWSYEVVEESSLESVGVDCIYDRCGVCNGDNSTCGESNELQNAITQKVYCSINDITTGFGDAAYRMTVSASVLDLDITTHFIPWCKDVDIMQRSIVTEEVLGDRRIYSLDMSLSDIQLCSSEGTRFFIAVNLTNDRQYVYRTACNYQIHYTTTGRSASYNNNKYGVTITTDNIQISDKLTLMIKTTINKIGDTDSSLLPLTNNVTEIGELICTEHFCTQSWEVTNVPLVDHCTKDSLRLEWDVSPKEYVTSNLTTVVDLDICDTVQASSVNIERPFQLVLATDNLRNNTIKYLVSDSRIYGSWMEEGCNRNVTVSKLTLICTSTVTEVPPHVIYDRVAGYSGGTTYNTLVVKNPDCQSRSDFEFTMRSIRNSESCQLEVDWVEEWTPV